MEIIGEAGTGLDAVRMAEGERPDVVLLDAKLGDDDGADVCRRVLAVSPATAVVVLTAYSQDGIILGALAAGAKGYLIKDVELDEIKRTVRAVYAGHSVLDPKVASRVIANVRTANGKAVSPGAAVLSERDLAIVRYIAAGLTNKAIAARVHLSPHTIKRRASAFARAPKSSPRRFEQGWCERVVRPSPVSAQGPTVVEKTLLSHSKTLLASMRVQAAPVWTKNGRKEFPTAARPS